MSVLETFDEQLLFPTQTQNSSDIITLALPGTGPSGTDNIALLLLDEGLSESSGLDIEALPYKSPFSIAETLDSEYLPN